MTTASAGVLDVTAGIGMLDTQTVSAIPEATITSGVLDIHATNVLRRNLAAKTRIIVNEGGSRSSKTWSLMQMLILDFLNSRNKTYNVFRKTMPSARITVLKDFFEVFNSFCSLNLKYWNKTENNYYDPQRNSSIQFLSLDDPQKKRGSKRDWLWMNEANEFDFEDFNQLAMRTSEKIILDYNPSDINSWIYDYVLTRDDATFIHSTLKDNPFLEEGIRKEIENYANMDEYYYKVYTLGERAAIKNIVYNNWDLNYSDKVQEVIYGLDFGFNAPTVLVEVRLAADGEERHAYLKEIVYEEKIITYDLIQRLKILGINKNAYIYADTSDPDRIEEIRRAGYNIKPADKGPSSVRSGIDYIKRYRLHIDQNSSYLLKEIKGYKWVEKNGVVVDLEPVKLFDHAMDAMRYAIYTHGKRYIEKSDKIGFRSTW